MNKLAPMVLILDDDDAVRESFAYHFEDQGWRIVAAATAEEALTMMRDETPDGAIVDIRLPGMGGNDFIRAALIKHPTLACVICTGSPEYLPPGDILAMPQVSRRIFGKPVLDLTEIEEALRRQIEKCSGKEMHHD